MKTLPFVRALVALLIWVPAESRLNAAAAGTVVAWGANDFGQTTVPAGLSGVVAIAAGDSHMLALKSDGTVVAWGDNALGKTAVPPSLNHVIAIAAAGDSSAALKSDGTVVVWGDNSTGQANVPTGLSGVIAISQGGHNSGETGGLTAALRNDGRVDVWGWNVDGQLNVPAGLNNVTAISTSAHLMALKSDGTIVAWGRNNNGQTNIPVGLTNVIAISAKAGASYALKNDGTVVAWGLNNFGQVEVPVGLNEVTAISGGGQHCLALRNDGTVVAWGRTQEGQANVPAGLSSVTAITAGLRFSAALVGTGATTPFITAEPQILAANATSSVTFSVGATGTPPLSYQWRKDGVSVAGASVASFTLSNVQPENAGIYQALVTASGNTTTSRAAIFGITTTNKVIGPGTEFPNIVHAGTGFTYDQILLEGAAAAVTADPGQILRLSYVDLNNDIVQVEFSGAGTLSVVLDSVSGPAAPLNYNQEVAYMKGHAGIIVVGANATTNLSVFSVGRANAANQSLFRSDVTYDGFADLAFIAISSTDGKFGGLRTANTSYFGTRGLTGVYAPNVEFTGPVFIGDIRTTDDATPTLIIGSGSDVRITGGDLLQDNGRAVQVSGIAQLRFTPGSNSHGTPSAAQSNRARFEQDGVDVTAQIVVNPVQP